MFFRKLELKNWKNFQSCDLEIGRRLFVLGPNASGKSNLLDAVRFLKDLAKKGGGLQTAVQSRGGLSKIRCLSARREPQVEISVEFSKSPFSGGMADWKYSAAIEQETRGQRRPLLKHEKVWRKGKIILQRPNQNDKNDEELLTQTHLEQISANREFRELAKFLASVQYLHIVPQLLRNSKLYSGPGISGDPFGRGFLDKIAEYSPKTRAARLKKIEKTLKQAVPQLKEFAFMQDRQGCPHLEAVYQHWRPQGAKQREDQFSDGTLRLIGLFWALLESKSLLLLEEPELSLHYEVIQQLPALMSKVLVGDKRQAIITTHSPDLLNDKGIGSNEVALIEPQKEGSRAYLAKDKKEIKKLMESGLAAAECALPATAKRDMQLGFEGF